MSSNPQSRNSHWKRRIKAKLFGGRRTRPCCFCRRELTPGTATLEHVLPLSLGGNWEHDNLRLSCQPCNNGRGSESFETFRTRKRGAAAIRAAGGDDGQG